MTLPKMRLKSDARRSKYAKDFLRDLDIKGWLYIYSMDEYNNWKKGGTFKTERPTILDHIDFWHHLHPNDWEEANDIIPVVHLPPELFEL